MGRWAPLAALLLSASLLLACATETQPAPGNRERELLLSFKAGITNWEEVQKAWGLVGWTECTPTDCTPVCSWSGVFCNPYHMPNSLVTELRLVCTPGICSVPMRGQLQSGLQRLPHLEILSLRHNQLAGPLPTTWGEPESFPDLLELDLSYNRFTGNMPDSWSIGPAFLSLIDLQLAGNRLSGPFPAGFTVTNTSFISVMSFSFASNRMSGTLPNYINGMITMSLVGLQDNLFQGTLPPEWGIQGYYIDGGLNNTQALECLYLHGNNLTGSLPAQWAMKGSFTTLKQLTLSDNPLLGGSLPPEWGAAGYALPALEDVNISFTGLGGTLPAEWGPGLQSLRYLRVAGNKLSGSVPASWTQLASLDRIVMQPGNPDMCTVLPPDAAFKLCKAGDQLCLEQLTSNSSNCAAPPPPALTGGNSDFLVAAVAVPVSLVVLAAIVAAGLLWRRQRRRAQAAAAPAVGQKTAFFKDAETGLVYDASGKPLANQPGATPVHSSAATCFPCLRSQKQQQQQQQLKALPFTSTGAPPSEALWQQPHQQSDTLQQLGSSSGSGGCAPASASTLPGSGSGGGGLGGALDMPQLSSRELQSLQLSDWEIKPSEIKILKRPDGSDWQLGSGGFGSVYKAMRNGVQPVAVKALGTASGEAVHAMSDFEFVQEISILRACRDTNILQFQGACLLGGRTLLVTEYMEGGSLHHNLRARKVSWWRGGKKVALDVARALVYLHSRRIIHLDIKSANVLLTRDGTAKVGDVGMAKIMAEDYVSGVVGTLAWSAPELLMGIRCTAKADSYSFGVVLWEIATMEVPVRGQLRDPIVPDECPAEVLALIYRCLSPDAAARPTATELVELLMQVPGSPSDVANSSGSGLASPFGSHSRAAAAAALAASSAMPGSTPGSTPASHKNSDEVGVRQEGGGQLVSSSRAGSAERPPRQGSALTSVSEDKAVQEAAAGIQPERGPSPLLPGAGGGGGLRRVVLTPASSLTVASPFRQVQAGRQ